MVTSTRLRTRFAAALSGLYGREVPAYTTLVEVSRQVNEDVLSAGGPAAGRLGGAHRVTAERHGAIRVGSPTEPAQVARIFGAFGMTPAGFYDLRDARPEPIPVIATAFRPADPAELAQNPFRVFTSMLVPQDRRFFDADLEQRLVRFIDQRELFCPELLSLADRAEAESGLEETDATRLLDLATAAFALSADPVDRAWYHELERVSAVAADIGGVSTTHINHLTPRVLDIDDLYRRMQARGIEMIDQIQGPPRWNGPDVLLRQTSFRALAEARRFREPDGSISSGDLRVRFGEVEARGIALTSRGRTLYDELLAEVDRRLADDPVAVPQQVAAQVWSEGMPHTETALHSQGLGFFTYSLTASRPAGGAPLDLAMLINTCAVTLHPIVYEDFLPQSAAGIFASNLSGNGSVDQDRGGAPRDMAWLSAAIDREVRDPNLIYQAQTDASLRALRETLRIPDLA
ncbi:VOC family protein [Flexivirga caeni]|uniref:2-oxoadipate dioxygenase/decarboxylase n=2 Tax=Flexivirga caeni TaxID=2294115 RepID=A0A3M9MBL4_9MICO|nr:VOC family protein [Flexivirga caeni]